MYSDLTYILTDVIIMFLLRLNKESLEVTRRNGRNMHPLEWIEKKYRRIYVD